MDHHEMVTLIRAAVPGGSGLWADLGAGEGNFTSALAALLGPGATIYAVDKVVSEDAPIAFGNGAGTLQWIEADFTLPMNLPALDGILMANALHFIYDQARTLAHVCAYLRPGGRFVLVEYAVHRPLAYDPYPVPFERFILLSESVGLVSPVQAGVRRSPRTGVSMYSACAIKPS